MSIRVLYVESAPEAGGSTVSLLELLAGLDRQAIEPVVMLCASNPYRQSIERLGIRVMITGDYCSVRTPSYPPALAQARSSAWAARVRRNRLTRSLWRSAGLASRTLLHTWPLARRLARTLRDERIDLVHLNDAPALHKAGILASRLAGVPCICHARSMPPLDVVDRALAHSVGRFVFISKAVEQDQRRRGLAGLPGSVVYNAVDLAPYQALDRQAARRFYNLSDSDVVVGMMGRIEPWKGQRDLLSALSQMAPQPALRCLIAGSAGSDVQWYQDELNGMVQALQLEQVVRFTGFVDNVPRFMAALDLLVHASTQPEPFGRVLIEAMAAGVPIVASNAGGVPEIIEHEQSGLLVSPANPTEMAAAMGRLLADRRLAGDLADNGRRRVQELFSVSAHVAAIQDIYRLRASQLLGACRQTAVANVMNR